MKDNKLQLSSLLTCDNKRCGRLVSITYRTYWLKYNKDICEACYFKEKLNRCRVGLMSIEEYKKRPQI